MERLLIENTKSTPLIDFDPDSNVLKIVGQSYPENSFKFYEPVLEWVDNYLKSAQTEILIEINFDLPYINSSSSKCIMTFLDKFNEAHQGGKVVTVNWYFDEDNESSFECAEEFKEDLELPFNIIKMDR